MTLQNGEPVDVRVLGASAELVDAILALDHIYADPNLPWSDDRLIAITYSICDLVAANFSDGEIKAGFLRHLKRMEESGDYANLRDDQFK